MGFSKDVYSWSVAYIIVCFLSLQEILCSYIVSNGSGMWWLKQFTGISVLLLEPVVRFTTCIWLWLSCYVVGNLHTPWSLTYLPCCHNSFPWDCLPVLFFECFCNSYHLFIFVNRMNPNYSKTYCIWMVFKDDIAVQCATYQWLCWPLRNRLLLDLSKNEMISDNLAEQWPVGTGEHTELPRMG